MAEPGSSLGEASDRPRQRSRSVIFRAVFAVLVVSVLTSGIYFARQSGANAEVYGNDFNVYYYAAREIIAGRDPYQRSLGEWTPYIYPPLLAELTVPLALLPLPAAAYLWFLINAGSIVAAAWMSAALASESGKRTFETSRRRLRESFKVSICAVDAHSSGQLTLAACAVAIVIRFALDNFNLGQVNPLLAALAVAHVYLYARRRKALSAIALAAAISIKLTPALFLVYHIAKLRLKFSVACIALLGALTVVSFLPFGSGGSEAFVTFVHRTIENQQGYRLADAGNQSLRGWVARLAAQDDKEAEPDRRESRSPTTGVTLLLSAVLLAGAIFSAVRAPGELSAAAPLFCCMVLLSPLSWKAHFVMLIPPIAYLFAALRNSTKARRLVISAVLGAAFVLFNLTSPRVIGLAAAEWADAHSLVLAGALLIFVACFASQREVA